MRITKHAKERMLERSITVSEVAHVLQHGVKLVNRHDSNKFTFVANDINVYAVVDKEMTALITVFRKEV